MSNEFNALRARDKRDKAEAAAQSKEAVTLVQVAALEQDIFGKVSSRYKKISTAIEVGRVSVRWRAVERLMSFPNCSIWLEIQYGQRSIPPLRLLSRTHFATMWPKREAAMRKARQNTPFS